jgi:hypothetical protein
LEKALDKATKKERQLAEQLEIAQTSATLTNAANKEAVTKVKEEAQAKIKELTEKIKELTKEKKDVSKENERLQLELSAANIAAQAAAAAKPPPNIAPAAGGKLFHVNVVVVVSFDVMFQSFCRYFSTWWYFQPICWRTAAFTAYGTAQSIPTVTSTNPPAVSWCSAAAAPHSGGSSIIDDSSRWWWTGCCGVACCCTAVPATAAAAAAAATAAAAVLQSPTTTTATGALRFFGWLWRWKRSGADRTASARIPAERWMQLDADE